MQLGTRWPLGAEPPARLPDDVIAAVREVENASEASSVQRRWTLTWLEGKPILELDPATGSDEFTTITFNPTNQTVTIGTSGFEG